MFREERGEEGEMGNKRREVVAARREGKGDRPRPKREGMVG